MAYNFRVNSAKDQSVKDFLAKLQQFQPNDPIYKAIESGDKQAFQSGLSDLGDSYISQADKQKLVDQFDQVQSKLPSQGDAFSSYNAGIKDQSTATDEELQNQIAAYQGLTKVGTPLDRGETMKNAVSGMLGNTENISLYEKNVLTPILSTFIADNRRLPQPGELADILTQQQPDGYGGIIENPAVTNFLNNQNNSNYIALNLGGQEPSHDNQIKSIQDILASRGQQRSKDDAFNKYISSIPDELSANRESYLASQKPLAQQQFQDYAQQALARENAAGRLFSGSVGDVLSTGAGAIQGGLEQARADLQSQDDAFYFNAAYQEQVRKLLEGRSDYNTALQTEHARVSTEQNTRFNQEQTGLNNTLSNDLLTQQYNNQLRAIQAQRQRQQDLANKQNQIGLYGGIGGAIGTIAGIGLAPATGGASLAIPVALGAAGSTAGSQVGKGVGG